MTLEAEKALLGALLEHNDKYRSVIDLVSGRDFSNPTLGAVYDGIIATLSAGGKLDSISIEAFFPQWGIVGLGQAEQFLWTDLGMPGHATHYAEVVKNDALRREGKRVLAEGMRLLDDTSADPSTSWEFVKSNLKHHTVPEIETLTLGQILEADDTSDWVIPGLMERHDRLVITGIEGNGKALALDTPIPTPSGWTTMGDISVGDYVFGADGTPARVTFATPVQYGRTCYSVEFSDGETIVADEDHLWLTEGYTSRMKSAKSSKRGTLKPRGTDQRHKREHFPTVVTTGQIRETLWARGGHTLNHSVKATDPLMMPDIELPVPPYVLGSWLGDGHTNGGRMTIGDQDSKEVLNEFSKEGLPCHKTSGKYIYGVLGLQVRLREAGVLGNKHIPSIYLRASYGQRLALMQGLMDSDGTISKPSGKNRGVMEFCVTSRELAEGFHELALSLGILPGFSSSPAKLYGRVTSTRYRIRFQTEIPVFRLSRKLGRMRPLRTQRSQHRFIKDVRPVETVPVRCIQVDNREHLYLAGRGMVPTHNTTLVRQMLILPAAGVHPLTFQQINPVTSLVIDAENTVRQWKRATSWMVTKAKRDGLADPSDRVHIHTSGRLDILDPSQLGGIHRLIDKYDPEIVFLGPLYRLALKFNKDEEAAPVIAALDSIRDRGVALIIEAHAGHALDQSGARSIRPRGSSMLLGWPEFGYGIRPSKDGDGLYDFIPWRGAREERDFPSMLRRGGPGRYPWEPVKDHDTGGWAS